MQLRQQTFDFHYREADEFVSLSAKISMDTDQSLSSEVSIRGQLLNY